MAKGKCRDQRAQRLYTMWYFGNEIHHRRIIRLVCDALATTKLLDQWVSQQTVKNSRRLPLPRKE